MAIRVVQANPALDRIEVLERLEVGSVNRSSRVFALAGGKGLNVARALRRRGHEVVAYGLVGGVIGEYLRRTCVELGITDRHVEVRGETRVCEILVDLSTGRSTVINEPGPIVDGDDEQRLIDSVAADCRRGEFVVIAGSLPPGAKSDLYARLVRTAQELGARVLVDTSGEALASAADSAPWMIKANARELAEAGLADRGLSTRLRSGIEWIIATHGAAGATAHSASGTWKATVPPLNAVNSTGAGDIFLAGLLDSLSSDGDMVRALRCATAWAAASVLTITPELPDESSVTRVLELTQIAEG
jgi:1-phosphofructokinase/tagatose 6-phosphate kinase